MKRWQFYTLSSAIIGIGILIALPLFLESNPDECGEGGAVPANMHTIQTMVETYAVDHQGIYPANFQILKQEASQTGKGYWKTFENPLTGYSGSGHSFTDEGQNTQPGIVTYQPQGVPPKRYKIFGYDKNNQRILRHGQEYYLTNS